MFEPVSGELNSVVVAEIAQFSCLQPFGARERSQRDGASRGCRDGGVASSVLKQDRNEPAVSCRSLAVRGLRARARREGTQLLRGTTHRSTRLLAA